MLEGRLNTVNEVKFVLVVQVAVIDGNLWLRDNFVEVAEVFHVVRNVTQDLLQRVAYFGERLELFSHFVLQLFCRHY